MWKQLMTVSLALVIALSGAAGAQDAAESSQNGVKETAARVEFQPLSGSNDRQNMDWIFTGLATDPNGSRNLTWLWEIADQGSGLKLVPVDDAVRGHLKLPQGQGLIVTSLVANGPAARAGLCENDILIALGDTPLGKPEDLEQNLKAAGDKPLGLTLLHHGQKKTLQVQPRIKVLFGPVQPAAPAYWIGVSVSPIEPALRSHLHISEKQGLIVTEVIAEGPAAKAAIKLNDILLSIGGTPLPDQDSLVKSVQKIGTTSVAVDLLREGSRQTVSLTPERRKTVSNSPLRGTLTGDFLVTHPGLVIGSNQPALGLSLDGVNFQSNTQFNPIQVPADPLARRLDGMAAEIKELRKAVDDLTKVLKDRK